MTVVMWIYTLIASSEQHPSGAGHRVVVEGLSSQSVRPLRGLTGEARSRPGVTVAGGPMPCTERYWSKLLHRLGRVAYVSDAASASPPTLSTKSSKLVASSPFSSSPCPRPAELSGWRRRAGGRGGGGGGGTVAAGWGWLLFCCVR